MFFLSRNQSLRSVHECLHFLQRQFAAKHKRARHSKHRPCAGHRAERRQNAG